MEDKPQYTPPNVPIPRINYGGKDWAEVENWLAQELVEVYQKLAKQETTWEQTLMLKGQASTYERMLEFKRLAGTFGVRE